MTMKFLQRSRATVLSAAPMSRLSWCMGLAALMAIAAPGSARAASYYVSTSGNDSNACSTAQSASTAKKTIQSGLSCLQPGDTLILRSGTYSGSGNSLSNLPNGSASAYITIRSETDGGAIVTGGLSTASTDAYLIFEGMRIQDTGGRTILGNHLKFKRMEFKGACSSGNCANVTIGSNDVSNPADILVEDSWVHGTGGR